MPNDGNFGADSKLYLRCNSCGERWPDGTVVPSNPGCCPRPDVHIWDYEHQWAMSWPGNFCKVCGLEDPIEYAVGCDPDYFKTCPVCLGVEVVARDCKECSGTGCIPDPKHEPKIPPCPGPSEK